MNLFYGTFKRMDSIRSRFLKLKILFFEIKNFLKSLKKTKELFKNSTKTKDEFSKKKLKRMKKMEKRIMKKLREKNTEETKSKEKELGDIPGLNFTVDLFGPTSITRELKTTAKTENKRSRTKQIEKKQETYQISKVCL